MTGSGKSGSGKYYAALAVCAVATAANAQSTATKPGITVPATCTFPAKVQVYNSLKDLPAVAAEFKRQRLDMADAGEPFTPYDVVDGKYPQRQFMRGYVFPDRTIVWYYHGGMVTHVHVVELSMQRDTSEAQPALRLTGENMLSYGKSACRATQAILDGVINGKDW